MAEELCDHVHRSKAMCNLRRGHPGKHGAPLLMPDGSFRWVSWNDRERLHYG